MKRNNVEKQALANEKEEEIILKFTPVLKDSLCTDCGACVPVCPVGIFKMVNGVVLMIKGAATKCNGCNKCRSVCATNAITVS
ncbi:MAG: 4Fe-4S dicluster domain-containing protein [Bacteroides sp.]